MELVLVNLNDKTTHIAKPKLGFSKYGYAQNLDPGRYLVVEIRVPVGNVKFTNSSQELHAYFGEISLGENALYYLGDYTGKQKIGFKDVMSMTKTDSLPPESLTELFSAPTSGWAGTKFEPIGPKVGDVLMVY